MNKLESVLENESYKIFRDFEVQTVLLIPAEKPDLQIINNNNNNNKEREFVDLWILPFLRTTELK